MTKSLFLLISSYALTMALLGSCAHLSGAAPEQRRALEARLVGKEAWLKRDLRECFEGKVLALTGEHVLITEVSYAPAVLLHITRDDGKTLTYNATCGRYNEERFESMLQETFAFSWKEFEERFNLYQFELAKVGGGSPVWEADSVRVELRAEAVPRGSNIVATITNDGNEPVSVEWASSSLVAAAGTAHRIVLGSTRRRDVGAGIPPTLIPNGAHITEILLPQDLVGGISEAADVPLFPKLTKSSDLVGETGTVTLSLTRAGVRRFITCVFEIAAVHPVAQKPGQ